MARQLKYIIEMDNNDNIYIIEMDYNYDKPRESKRKMMSGEIMNLHQIQRRNLHHDVDDEGLFKACTRLSARFKNAKFPKRKIKRTMQVNGHAWCNLTKM